MWTCPMCAGFWIAIPVCLALPFKHPFTDIMVVFGANWLIHCLENLMFFWGKIAETADESIKIEAIVKVANKTMQTTESYVQKITQQTEQLSKTMERLANKIENSDLPTNKTFKNVERKIRDLKRK